MASGPFFACTPPGLVCKTGGTNPACPLSRTSHRTLCPQIAEGFLGLFRSVIVYSPRGLEIHFKWYLDKIPIKGYTVKVPNKLPLASQWGRGGFGKERGVCNEIYPGWGAFPLVFTGCLCHTGLTLANPWAALWGVGPPAKMPRASGKA